MSYIDSAVQISLTICLYGSHGASLSSISFQRNRRDPTPITSMWGIPRTGYLVLGRDGVGVWPDGRVVGTLPPPSLSSGSSGWHSGQGTIFLGSPAEFNFWSDLCGRWYRQSTQNFDPHLLSIVVWFMEAKLEHEKVMRVFRGSFTFPGTRFQNTSQAGKC